MIYLIKDLNIIYNINQNTGEKYQIQKLIQVLAIYLPLKKIFLGLKQLKTVYKQKKQYSTSHNKIGKREQQILIDIKEELKQNEAIIIKAHTGNSIIIIKEKLYSKVNKFINENDFMYESINYANKFRQLLGKT